LYGLYLLPYFVDDAMGIEYSQEKDDGRHDDEDEGEHEKKEKLASNDDAEEDSVPEANLRKRETFSIMYQQAKIRRGKYMSCNISHIN